MLSNKEETNQQALFTNLFSDLFENKLIYYERVIALCEVDKYDVSEKGFRVWLRPLRLLYQNKLRPHFYEALVEKQIFSLGASFEFFGEYKLFDGKKIVRPYCPFALWPNKDLVEQVSKMNEEELEEKLDDLLWN